MIKTRIGFEDIKAGDLLEVVVVEFGVKSVMTGVAFERVGAERHGIFDWQTSQGGAIVSNIDEAEIWRIDVMPVKFEDIREGDVLAVTTVVDDVECVMRGTAHHFSKADGGWYDSWVTEQGQTLVHRDYGNQTVEILERQT